jgi:hypothetical protein
MASGCYCLSHFWDGAEETLPPDNLYSDEFKLQEKIIRYAALSEAQKDKQRALMRSIVCERFDIEQTKREIHRVIEEAAGAYTEVE